MFYSVEFPAGQVADFDAFVHQGLTLYYPQSPDYLHGIIKSVISNALQGREATQNSLTSGLKSLDCVVSVYSRPLSGEIAHLVAIVEDELRRLAY